MPIKHLVFFYMLLLSILASTLLGKVLMCLVGWHMSALSLFFSNRRLKFLIKWPAKNTHSQHILGVTVFNLQTPLEIL